MERLDYKTERLLLNKKTASGTMYDREYIVQYRGQELRLPFLESVHAENLLFDLGPEIAVLTIDNRFDCVGLHLWSSLDDWTEPESIYMQAESDLLALNAAIGEDWTEAEPETILDNLLSLLA